MRIHIISDLHQEFGEVSLPMVECDCVVIAGDVATKHHGFEWIKRTYSDVPVVYVCGNHEYYGEKLPRLTDRLRRDARGTNIHFLENDSVTIAGIDFFGCTLWTDMSLHGDWRTGAAEAETVMSDYKRIRNSAHGFRRLAARDTRLLHLESLEAMRQFFGARDASRSVIVTHHAPSIASLPDHRRVEAISCAYASRLESFIEDHQPQLWIHGHIHHSQDYRIGDTRIIANPRGYPDEPNPGFTPDLVVTVNS